MKIRKFLKNHKKKLIFFLIFIVAIIAIYYSTKTSATVTQYVAEKARVGNISTTVSGSGQVSASNQVDITSLVSGTITSIKANVGDNVKKGQLIATIDATDAIRSLESARIAYAKLTEPAKPRDLEASRDKLNKDYSDAFNEISIIFSQMPSIIDGMKTLFTDNNAFLSQNKSTSMNNTGALYRENANLAFDTALVKYNSIYQNYKNNPDKSSATTVDRLLNDLYSSLKDISASIQQSSNAITFLHTSQPEYNSTNYSSANTNVNSWLSSTNTYLSSLISYKNTILSDTNSLSTLNEGADELDVASQLLSLKEQEKNYSNYFIRAPFDGIIAKIPVNIYERASSGTAIATIIGQDKVSTITLNEIDALKVKVGQPVLVTFDAIDNLIATGTVRVVDLVGTVSQGVVSYNVKISIDSQDTRIRPGMSVNATITTDKREGVLVVPSSSVKAQGKIKYVETVIYDGNAANLSTTTLSTSTRKNTFAPITVETTPTKMTVETGISNDTSTEIISGINPGTYVVTKTISGTSQKNSTTPSILSSIGSGARNTTRVPGATR